MQAKMRLKCLIVATLNGFVKLLFDRGVVVFSEQTINELLLYHIFMILYLERVVVIVEWS